MSADAADADQARDALAYALAVHRGDPEAVQVLTAHTASLAQLALGLAVIAVEALTTPAAVDPDQYLAGRLAALTPDPGQP